MSNVDVERRGEPIPTTDTDFARILALLGKKVEVITEEEVEARGLGEVVSAERIAEMKKEQEERNAFVASTPTLTKR